MAMAQAEGQQTFDLGSYQRKKVQSTVVKITKAGDGLSEALSIEPVNLPINGKVYVLLECEVEQHAHKRVRTRGRNAAVVPNLVQLIQTLEAQTVTLVDADLAKAPIEAQRQRIAEARAAAEAEAAREDPEDDEATVLTRQHFAGAHSNGLRPGCPQCDLDAAAKAAEDGEPAPPSEDG